MEVHQYFRVPKINLKVSKKIRHFLFFWFLSQFVNLSTGLFVFIGIHGEHSDSVGGVYDISNKRRMGLSEIQAVQEMRVGVERIIALERALQKK